MTRYDEYGHGQDIGVPALAVYSDNRFQSDKYAVQGQLCDGNGCYVFLR